MLPTPAAHSGHCTEHVPAPSTAFLGHVDMTFSAVPSLLTPVSPTSRVEETGAAGMKMRVTMETGPFSREGCQALPKSGSIFSLWEIRTDIHVIQPASRLLLGSTCKPRRQTDPKTLDCTPVMTGAWHPGGQMGLLRDQDSATSQALCACEMHSQGSGMPQSIASTTGKGERAGGRIFRLEGAGPEGPCNAL